MVKAGSLTSAIRTLEVLLRSHISSMEKQDSAADEKAAAGQLAAATRRKGSTVKAINKPKANKRKLDNIEENEVVDVDDKIRNEKVTVTVRIIFLKIGTIDTIHDRFSADVMVLSKWREPALDGKKDSAESIEWESYWDPKLSIANGIGDMKYTVTYSLQRNNHGGETTVCEHKHCTGQFFEFMELEKFPFDSQDLTVHVTSDRSESELEFVEDTVDSSGVNMEAFSAEQEWHLETTVNTWKKFTSKKTARGRIKIPNIYIAAKASRRPQFFIYNIIIIMFSISSLAFSTFTVNLSTPESRLPLTYILVLTTVTFKFVVNKSLPKISYLTYLDKYILGSMIILCSVCVWHAIAGAVVCPYTASPNTTISTTTTSTTTTTTAAAALNVNATATTTTAATTTTSATATTPKGSVVISCTRAKCNASSTAIFIDYIALGVLASTYVGFHLVFVVLINCTGGDEGPNEERDMDDDEDDDDGGKRSPSNNMNSSTEKLQIETTAKKSNQDLQQQKENNLPSVA